MLNRNHQDKITYKPYILKAKKMADSAFQSKIIGGKVRKSGRLNVRQKCVNYEFVDKRAYCWGNLYLFRSFLSHWSHLYLNHSC